MRRYMRCAMIIARDHRLSDYFKRFMSETLEVIRYSRVA
jgi:hypothetical protein